MTDAQKIEQSVETQRIEYHVEFGDRIYRYVSEEDARAQANAVKSTLWKVTLFERTTREELTG